jgi:hypothetical protein
MYKFWTTRLLYLHSPSPSSQFNVSYSYLHIDIDNPGESSPGYRYKPNSKNIFYPPRHSIGPEIYKYQFHIEI